MGHPGVCVSNWMVDGRVNCRGAHLIGLGLLVLGEKLV
jgi:hypothetical protein